LTLTLPIFGIFWNMRVSKNPTSQAASGLRPQADRLLRSWFRTPPGAWISVCCEYRVLSGRGLCDELVTRPEESYRLRCVVVCDLETSRMDAPYIYIYIYIYDISSLKVNDLNLILLTWRNGELLIMPVNSRWDLIQFKGLILIYPQAIKCKQNQVDISCLSKHNLTSGYKM